MSQSTLTRFFLLAAATLGTALSASASERRFAFTYEATTAPKGAVELENWVTWRHTDAGDGDDSDVFRFRHELEFGVTDRLQVGLYLLDWQYDDKAVDKKSEWLGSGVEVIYNLTNPTTDFIGSALYGEVLVGHDSLKVEGKLLLQKDFGALRIAYNATIEAEWEGEEFGNFSEENGEFAQTLGVSYDVSKSFSVGAEVLHEIELPDWAQANDSVVYAGPNASVRAGRFFATATALFQLTDVDGEPDTQVRLITGLHF
jgi:hypothetical protein